MIDPVFNSNQTGFSRVLATDFFFLMDVPAEITTDSPTYTPPGGDSSDYHYILRQMTVASSGEYSIRSSGSFPSQGFVYRDKFDPSMPTKNIVAQGRSDSNGQLQFNAYLEGSSPLSKRVCIHLSSR